MNQVLTSELLKGLEAAQKVNKGMGKINKDRITVTVSDNKMIVNSIDFINQTILTIPVEQSENFSVGIIGLEKLVKGLKKFATYTTFEQQVDKIVVSDGKKKLQMQISEGEVDDVKIYNENDPFIIDGIRLNDAYNKVKKSIAKEEKIPILCGVHFKNDFVETVDGYRISQVKISESEFNHDFVVNPKGLEIILPVAKKDKLPVKIDVDQNKAIMNIENKEYSLTVVSNLYDGEFLKTDQVFNNDYEYMMKFSENKELLSEVEFIKDMGEVSKSGKPLPTRFLITKDRFVIANNSEDTTTTVSMIKMDSPAKSKDIFKIAFNPNYMIDAIKNISGEFTMQFISALAPIQIKNQNERYVVLPIRINN